MSGQPPASPAPPPMGAPATEEAEAAGSRREAAKAEASAPSDGRGRRAVKAVVLLLLALVWIRFVLFAWIFPIVERRFDSPEIGPADDPAVEVESLGQLPSLTEPFTAA